MLKCFITFLAIAAVLFAAVWFGGGWALDRATRSQLPRIESLASREQLKVSKLAFESASVSMWPVGAKWSDWSGTAQLRGSGKKPPRDLPVTVSAIAVTVAGWSPLAANLRLEGLEINSGLDPELAGEELPFNAGDSGVDIDRLTEGFAELPGVLVSADPARTAADLSASLRELFTSGSTSRDIRLGSRIHLRVRGLNLSGRLVTERIDGRSILRLNRDDVEEMAAKYGRRLTNAEKDILAKYPLRALSLLRIKEYAERLSAALTRNDSSYGEDFTRHVIWSYWLARVFGDEFAMQVTDAHEQGDTGNTVGERAQDFANNAVGRRYAMAGKSENQVLTSIRSDPSIVREAR